MKKIISTLLVLSMLILTGCSTNVEQEMNNGMDNVETFFATDTKLLGKCYFDADNLLGVTVRTKYTICMQYKGDIGDSEFKYSLVDNDGIYDVLPVNPTPAPTATPVPTSAPNSFDTYNGIGDYDASTDYDDDTSDYDDTTDYDDDEDVYIFPTSDSEYLTKDDLTGLDYQTINRGKNEIYARYGRGFDSVDLQDYFDEQSWYTKTYTPEEWTKLGDEYFFNKYELANRNLLVKRENKLKKKK